MLLICDLAVNTLVTVTKSRCDVVVLDFSVGAARPVWLVRRSNGDSKRTYGPLFGRDDSTLGENAEEAVDDSDTENDPAAQRAWGPRWAELRSVWIALAWQTLPRNLSVFRYDSVFFSATISTEQGAS